MKWKNAQHHIVSPMVYVIIFLSLLMVTGLTVWASFIEMGVLNPDRRAGHCLHQGDAGGAVLHAREVQLQADQADRCRGHLHVSTLIGMTLADYISRAWGRW